MRFGNRALPSVKSRMPPMIIKISSYINHRRTTVYRIMYIIDVQLYNSCGTE